MSGTRQRFVTESYFTPEFIKHVQDFERALVSSAPHDARDVVVDRILIPTKNKRVPPMGDSVLVRIYGTATQEPKLMTDKHLEEVVALDDEKGPLVVNAPRDAPTVRLALFKRGHFVHVTYTRTDARDTDGRPIYA